LKGAVLGYVYALEQGECEQQELLMHLQIQLRHIGIAMSDQAVRKFMHQSLAQVKHSLCYQIPKHASDLERLAQSFSESCAHAYQDPCARVGREPLRKLEHNERVMGSLATLLKYSLPFDVVLKGAVLGYVYALEQGECEQQELLMHLQIQLRH
ncbi:hypothetical protein, partial [Staphylococcus aureus]|uniref:hypothetical protein n=1 Tax=Staphylococcus aureus TaxID=1280 RepID=UPI001C5291C7